MDLGQNVKRFRQLAGMNQKQLAEISAISQATISRIESGRVRQVRSDALARLALALNVATDDLMRGASTVDVSGSVGNVYRAPPDLPEAPLGEALDVLRSYQRLSSAGREQLRLFARFLEEQEFRARLASERAHASEEPPAEE